MAALMLWVFKVRSGGYVVGAIMAAIIIRSWQQAALIILGVAVCYMVVKFTLRYTHIIGLKRYVFGMVVAYVITIGINLLASQTYIEGYAVAMLAPIQIIATFTNELTLQPLRFSAISIPAAVGAAYLIGVAV
jgi:hypothetical protein